MPAFLAYQHPGFLAYELTSQSAYSLHCSWLSCYPANESTILLSYCLPASSPPPGPSTVQLLFWSSMFYYVTYKSFNRKRYVQRWQFYSTTIHRGMFYCTYFNSFANKEQ